jgi:hypothetical protein
VDRVLLKTLVALGLACLMATGAQAQNKETNFDAKSFRSALVEHSRWEKLAPALFGTPVLNKRNKWAINAVWFQRPDSLDAIYDGAALKALGDRGLVPDTMTFYIINYHYVVKAKNAAEARRAGLRKRPAKLPRWVLRKMGLGKSPTRRS